MIGSLRGTVLDRIPPGEVLVEVAGVGYRTVVGPRLLAALAPGAPTFLHTHLHVREDALTLYGFPSQDERACFEALIGAHGVGPSLALAILSVHPPDALHRVLAEHDVAALCLVPGVGKKTAARLVMELQSRLDVADLEVVDGVGAPGGEAARVEVREALLALGYRPEEVRDTVRELPGDGDVQLLVRDALKRLASTR
jgi:holliday junction DNA helicase RuvA